MLGNILNVGFRKDRRRLEDSGGESAPVRLGPVGKNLPEKRSITNDYDAKLGRLNLVFGTDVSAGVAVNEHTALGVGAVVACVQILSVMTAKLPIYLYKRTKNGPVEVEKHPAIAMLSGNPSQLHTAFELRSLMQTGIGLGGNGYARVYRDGSYDPAEMEWLAPCDVNPRLIKRADGRRFAVYDVNGIREPLTRADIVHVRSPICLDGLNGMSPVRMLRESIGTSISQTSAAGKLMKNGAKWPGFMTVEGISKKEQLEDIRDEVNNNLAGAMNAGRIPVVGGSMKFQQTNGMSMVDAQFVESRKLELHEIARHYGIPAFMVDSTATSTWGAGIEQQMLGFMNLSLDSWLVNWEQCLAFTLLTAEEVRKGFYFRFDLSLIHI